MIRLLSLGLLFGASVLPAAAQLVPVPDRIGITLIYGEVAPVCTVEAADPVVTVQMATGRQDVTNILYTCNHVDGFTRRVSSDNGGALVRGAQSVSYLLSQSGTGDLAFAPILLQGMRTDDVATFPELATGSSGVLRIEIPEISPSLLAGEYVDTVTIEITPN